MKFFSNKLINLSLTVKIGLIFCALSVSLFGPVIYFYYSNTYNVILQQLTQRVQLLGGVVNLLFTSTEMEHIQKLAEELEKHSILRSLPLNLKTDERVESVSPEETQRLMATEDFQDLTHLLQQIQESYRHLLTSNHSSETSPAEQVDYVSSYPIHSLYLVVAIPQSPPFQILKFLVTSDIPDRSNTNAPQLGTLYVVPKSKSLFWTSAFAGRTVTEADFYTDFYRETLTPTVSMAIPLRNQSHQVFAVLNLELNAEKEFHQLKLLQLISISLFQASMILSLILAFFLGRWLEGPITKLQQATQKICLHDFNTTVNIHSNDEWGHLANTFNTMVTELRDHLQAQRNHLAEVDKMAAVGSRVAGFSHEINTPLGLGVTAGSFLEELAKRLAGLYSSGNLKRSDLEKYFADVGEGHQILLRNLHRAADLIKSFKHISVDEAGEQKRTFNLKEYFEEILLLLKPRLKNTEYRVTILCPEDLTLSSYPGIFSQIFINLIMNSLIHGFQNQPQGQITIQAMVENQQLTLHYQDNGVGIPPDIIDKIFDPFFTTNREGGGSGLGLHIIYELVTQSLKGTIRCESVVGEGTSFIITMPKT